MDTLTLYSYEDLTTLERGLSLDPIDMPESETFDRKEYVISRQEFLSRFAKWDRDAHPLLVMNDDLSESEIWLSQPQATRIKRAVDEGKDSIDLEER